MRLVSTCTGWVHGRIRSPSVEALARVGPIMVLRIALIGTGGIGGNRMGVHGHFILRQCVHLLTASLTLGKTTAQMEWSASAKIRKRKCLDSISAIGRSQKGKKCLVLIYWQDLTAARCPTFRGKIKSKNPNFTYKWG